MKKEPSPRDLFYYFWAAGLLFFGVNWIIIILRS